MSKFKVGDRVIVLEDEKGFLQAGEIGVVIDIDDDIQVQSINPSYGEGLWFTLEDNLQLMKEGELASDNIKVSVEKTITLSILEDEYELTEEDSRFIIKELQKALGEYNE